MCKSSPFVYSFWLVILFGSMQVTFANNNCNGEQQNQNTISNEQAQLSMVEAPQTPNNSDELKMVDRSMNPNSTARIEREGSLVDIADLGGGRTATTVKKEDHPEEEK